MNSLKERLTWAREEKGLTKSELARMVKLTPQAVIQYESGISDIAHKRLKPLADALGVSPEWLRFGDSLPQFAGRSGEDLSAVYCKVPVLSWEKAKDWLSEADPQKPGEGVVSGWIDVAKKVGLYAFALHVDGDTMEPRTPEGSVIIVDPQREAVNGALIVAHIDGSDRAVFRQFVVDGDEEFLKPINQRYPVTPVTGRSYEVCGVVCQVIIDLD
jgi:SOS-response transcriptional repressor LexA